MLSGGSATCLPTIARPWGVVPKRGPNEYTLRELRRQIVSQPDGGFSRSLAFTYHQKWALSGATIALVLFAMSIARRSSPRLLTGFIVAVVGLFGYYVLLYGGRSAVLNGTVPLVRRTVGQDVDVRE